MTSKLVFLRTLLALASLSAFLFSSVESQAQHQLIRQVYDTKTNTWVQVTCLVGKLPAYGYAPVRIEINNGTKEARDFTLNFSSADDTSYGNESGSRLSSTFSCSCAAQSKESYDFLVPVTTIFQTNTYGSGTALNLDLSCSGFTNTNGRMYTETHDSWPSVLISKALYVPNASSLTSHISSSHSSRGDLQFAGDFTPAMMPTDWRAYIGQDVIMMTSSDWTSLDPGARTAILEWNRFGGRLIIYTTNSSDNLASLQIDTSAPDQQRVERSMGSVSLLPLPSSNRLNASNTTAMISGGIVKTKSGQPNTNPPGYRKSGIITGFNSILYDYSSSWPLEGILEEKHFHTAFFILVLLAFGILVGPINLFVFAKAGKRHKLFITTPIISLGASALLIVLILFQDGFGGRGHRVILIELQPEENNAYITQEQAARTGVLLSSAFKTSEPAMISPVALQASRWSRVVLNGNSPSSYSVEHGTQGLNLSGDWFQSRSIHGHLLKTVRPTRGRVELSPRAGAPVLTSSFEHDLGTIFYQADDQSWWTADALEKGNSVTLQPTTEDQFNVWLDKQAQRFAKQNALQLRYLAKQPGRFYAITEDAKAIDTYQSIKWLSTTTIITGPVSR